MKKPYTNGCFISAFPERIKATLYQGILTIKAGSKLYVPSGVVDGVKQFTDYTVPTDTICDYSLSAGSGFLISYINTNTNYCGAIWINRTCIGDSPELTPSNPNNATILWWDTANNLMKRSTDNGATWANTSYVPVSSHAFTQNYGFRDAHLFNFVGCLGNGVWMCPNITFNAPNGWDADGNPVIASYTSSAHTFKIDSYSSNVTGGLIMGNDTGGGAGSSIARITTMQTTELFYQDTAPTTVSGFWYDTLNNKSYIVANSAWFQDIDFPIGRYSWNASTQRYTSFTLQTSQEALAKYYF